MLLVINIVVIFSFGSTLPLPEVQQTEQRRDVVGKLCVIRTQYVFYYHWLFV